MPNPVDIDREPVNVAAINVHSAAVIFVNFGGRADLLAALVERARQLVDSYDRLGALEGAGELGARLRAGYDASI